MLNRNVANSFCATAVILLIALTLPFSGFANEYDSERATVYGTSKSAITSTIFTKDKIDADFDGIQDSLEAALSRASSDIVFPVLITLKSPVSNRDIQHFRRFGGNVTHLYRYVASGFAGTIPARNLTRFATIEKQNLILIEQDVSICYHLDVSVPLVRARSTVWDAYGYLGSPDNSIAIIDTGIDDSHPDVGPFQSGGLGKIVGWFDATADSSPMPEDYGEHGTHVAGIAAGTGIANGMQKTGSVTVTFTYKLPARPPGPYIYGYVDYIDVMIPGVIKLNCSWGGSNNVLLALNDPNGGTVAQKSGTSQPLVLSFNTTLTSYPTGRYRVFVGNVNGPSGNPFSCIETYPYHGLDDGHNLFTGMAPNSKLVGVKVFDNQGAGTLSTLVAGMDWVVQNRITYKIVVASMSIGLENGAVDTTLDEKADAMVESGIVTVVSAGNDFPNYAVGSPGTAAYVITVGATNDQNAITDYSSNGDVAKNEYGLVKPDVVAPGGTFQSLFGNKIVSADSNDVDAEYSGYGDRNVNDYQQMAGTSMSAPHVSGLAALIVQALGEWHWTLDESLMVKMLIGMTSFETQSGESTNQPILGRGEKDNREGYGRVSSDAAIEAATTTYSIGQTVSATLGSGFSDKKVWARKVLLSNKTKYAFDLAVPSGADYDLYLYSGVPDSFGQPVILAKSVSAFSGGAETVEYTPLTSGIYYVVVKWVAGSGGFNLQSTSSLPDHDVGVIRVWSSEAEFYAGKRVNITATVKNYGAATETFSVTALCDENIIETKLVTGLGVGASRNITFTWDTVSTVPRLNYTIRAVAETLFNEVDTADNVLDGGVVKVKMPGDTDGNGLVDLFDLACVSKAYRTSVGEPGYNIAADFNYDDLVDLLDLTWLAKNYGKKY